MGQIKLKRSHGILIATCIIISVAGLAWWLAAPLTPRDEALVSPSERPVVSRARIEPASRVRVLQGPSGAILAKMLVREGEHVDAGAILAETNQRRSREAELLIEERRLEETERQLLQASAPAKRAEMESSRALVQQRSAELAQLRRELERVNALAAREIATTEAAEVKRAAVEKAEHVLRQADSSWRSLTETRDVDVRVAAARVEVQKGVVERARAELELTRIRAPVTGEILLLSAREGEAIGSEGVIQMADLSKLVVIAEVDETAISRVTNGQKAVISGPVLGQPLTGKVVRVSKSVFKQKRPTSDILVGRDARIVEVEVEADQALPPIVGAEVVVTLERVP